MASRTDTAQKLLEQGITDILLEGGALSPRDFARRLISGPLGGMIREPGLPAVASLEMRRAAVSHALSVTISGEYRWTDYAGDLWEIMAETALRQEEASLD